MVNGGTVVLYEFRKLIGDHLTLSYYKNMI